MSVAFGLGEGLALLIGIKLGLLNWVVSISMRLGMALGLGEGLWVGLGGSPAVAPIIVDPVTCSFLAATILFSRCTTPSLGGASGGDSGSRGLTGAEAGAALLFKALGPESLKVPFLFFFGLDFSTWVFIR